MCKANVRLLGFHCSPLVAIKSNSPSVLPLHPAALGVHVTVTGRNRFRMKVGSAMGASKKNFFFSYLRAVPFRHPQIEKEDAEHDVELDDDQTHVTVNGARSSIALKLLENVYHVFVNVS